VNDLKLMPIVT